MKISTARNAAIVLTTAFGLSGCTDLDEYEQAAVGASIGGVVGALIGEEVTDDRGTQRIITAAGAATGGAIGRSQGAKNTFCVGDTQITRTARRDNRTGAVVYDTTEQRQSENCTGGRQSTGSRQAPAPIF